MKRFSSGLGVVVLAAGLHAAAPAAPSSMAVPAGTPAASPTAATAPGAEDARSLLQWLERLHEAGRSRSYVGTFVVSSAHGQMSSARIAHVCDGRQQMEHVETLSGPPRHTFRHDHQVVTFLPHRRLVITGQQDALQVFPQRLRAARPGIVEHYAMRRLGADRVAGFDADVVQVEPRDGLRFGYRIWSERRTGLVVQMQTLGADGQVLEQVAFSELRLDAPVRMERIARQMARTEGYRVERHESIRTTPEAEGWALRQQVPGFESTGCQRRTLPSTAGGHDAALQWTFSDGLATVSMFIEPFDPQRHGREWSTSQGATQAIARRLTDPAAASVSTVSGGWWLTVVGEAPRSTLEAFARSLERRR